MQLEVTRLRRPWMEQLGGPLFPHHGGSSSTSGGGVSNGSGGEGDEAVSQLAHQVEQLQEWIRTKEASIRRMEVRRRRRSSSSSSSEHQ